MEFTNQMMHAEHITMFGAFGLASIIDLLQYHKLSWLPDGKLHIVCSGSSLLLVITPVACEAGEVWLTTDVKLHFKYLLDTDVVAIIDYRCFPAQLTTCADTVL